MSVVSILGGVLAYTRTGSIPSVVASFTIGGAMALSSMRIKDGMDYGVEGAAGKFETVRILCKLYGTSRIRSGV
jgi:uncharacterized membrane protein (UPF0136 family)